MNLKNINKFNLIIFSLFFLSCQSVDFLNNKEQQLVSTIFEEIENSDSINNIVKKYNSNDIDFYSSGSFYRWHENTDLNKLFSLIISSKKYSLGKYFWDSKDFLSSLFP